MHDIIYYRNLVVVFTGKDTLDHENRDFGEFLQTSIHPMIEDVLRKCNNHCVPFNNKADAQENSSQVKNLLDMVDEVVAQNDGSFFSAEIFNSTRQKLRRTVASSMSAFSAKFHFNLGVLYIMVALVILMGFLSSVFMIVCLIQQPDYRTNDTEPILHPINGPTNKSSMNIVPQPQPTRDLPSIQSYPYAQVILSSARQGICLKFRNKRRCVAHWFDPTIPTPDLPSIRSYPYTQVLLSVVGGGVCSVSERYRCVPHWFKPIKWPPIRCYPYTQILLSSVRQGICLRFKTKRLCVAHWFDPAIPTPDLPPLPSYPYTQVLLSVVGRGVCLVFERYRCVPRWLKPITWPSMRSYPYAQILLSSVRQGICLRFKTKRRCVAHWFDPAIPTPDLPPVPSYPYAQVLLSVVDRGVCLVFENKRDQCDVSWFDPLMSPKEDNLLGAVSKALSTAFFGGRVFWTGFQSIGTVIIKLSLHHTD